MKKFIVLAILLLVGIQQALAQSPFREGEHYSLIEQASPATRGDAVTVKEAFSYLCNHCMTFEPYAQNWKTRLPEGVEFSRLPVEFGRQTWGLYARAYVAASLMGIAEEAHGPLMDRIWKDKKPLRNMEELAAFYAGFGVEENKFLATAKSFAVDMQMRREQSQVREFGVSGTPTMIVNDKYRVAAGGAISNFDIMLEVVDYLVAQELQAQAASAAEEPDVVAESTVAE